MNASAAGVVPESAVNFEAEQGVLAALLLNNDVFHAVTFLRAEHFAEELHRIIYEAIAARIADGRAATILTVAGDLPPLERTDFSGASYLASLGSNAWTTSENIVGTAKELVLLAGKRRLGALATSMAVGATAPGMKAGDLVAAAELELIQIGDEITRLSAPEEATADSIVADIDRRMTSGEQYKGPRSGFDAVDHRLGGFAPGELVVIAGRPGMGKTALGLSMARRAAHIGVGIGFDTLEMTKAALWHRLLSDESMSLVQNQITYKAISSGRLTPAEFAVVKRASAILKGLPLVILDRGNRLSDIPSHIRAARRALAKQSKELDLFVVDYLGLIQPGDRYAGSKVNEVGEISATLKMLAKRENLAIIALHQLNRANESREADRRPRLSDLRDSGNLEQDADVVMFVYRDAYYIERPGYRKFDTEIEKLEALQDCQNRLEVIVAKQRQGEIGTCKLWCDMATNAVRDEARV